VALAQRVVVMGVIYTEACYSLGVKELHGGLSTSLAQRVVVMGGICTEA
jgi:hypothetical protein